MDLDSQKLKDQNVTDGATRKILIEIEKLKERSNKLNSVVDVRILVLTESIKNSLNFSI